MSVLIAIGVDEWHNIKVKLIKNVSMSVCIIEELSDDVRNSCRADPLPGMYATINPDSWLPWTMGRRVANLDEKKLPPLIRVPDLLIMSLV